MKKIYSLILILISFATVALAQNGGHDKISYQSVVRDGSNHLVYNTQVTVAVSIANSSNPTSVVYSETHTVTSNDNGLISFLIGDGSSPSGSWDAIQWNRADITLVTSVNGTVLATHTLPLSAVPYALYAKNAGASVYADSVDINVVKHYVDQQGFLTEEVQVLSISNDTIFLTGGSWVKLPAGFSGDYNDLVNKPELAAVATSGDYNDLANRPRKTDLCDSVKDCVTGWISDTLDAYYDTTRMKTAIHDTAEALRSMMGDAAHDARITIQKNEEEELGYFTLNQATDKTINIPIPTTVAELSDAGNYLTSESDPTVNDATLTIKNGNTILGTFTANAAQPSNVDIATALPTVNDATLTIKNGNTILGTFTANAAQPSNVDIATALPTVNDNTITIVNGTTELGSFTTNASAATSVNIASAIPTVNNATLTIKNGNTILGTFTANADQPSNVDIATALPTVNDNTITIVNGTTELGSFTTNASAATSVNIASAIPTVNDATLTIKRNGTEIGTFTANQGTAETVNIEVPTVNDATLTIKKGNTILGTFTANAAQPSNVDIASAIPTVNDGTLSITYGTNNPVTFTANQQGNSAIAIPAPNDKTISIVNGTTELGSFTTNASADKSIDIASAIPTVNDATLTIQRNGTAVGSFTANDDDNTEINITVPTRTSELTNNSNFAYTTGNTFTGSHDFTTTGTSITVPSNSNVFPRPQAISGSTPTECTNLNAVNVCDLLAVFDSLTKRMDSLSGALAQTQEELEILKNSTPPVFNSLQLSDTTAKSIKATANFSSTGAAITTYEFCVKKSDVSGAPTNCFSSTSNEYTFTGLDHYTSYDVTVKATNMAGTTSSSVKTARTYANKPSGVFTTQTVYPLGIKVTVENLDFGGAPSGTVKIYYKKKGNAACNDNLADYGNPLTTVVNLTSDDDSTFVQTIGELDPSAQYCVMVELINDDSSRVYGPEMETSGSAVSLTITSNAKNGNLDVCESASVNAVYTATPSEGNAGDYAYQWEIVGTSVSQNTENTNTVEFAHAVGTYTISCTATSNTSPGVQVSNTYSVTVTNTGRVPSFSICYDSLQVTLSDILHADTIKWGDNAESVLSSNTASHLYQNSQAYTVTAKNSSGCTASKDFPVGLSTMHPCTVATKYENEDGSGNTISTLHDYDGNSYAVVQIGNQCWMKSNLRTTHYSDGTAIPDGTSTNANNVVSDYSAYYYKPNASSTFDDSYDFTRYNVNTYGLYYNWSAVMHGAAGSNEMPSGVQGVCPTGWHVPSLREWDTLIAFVQTLPGATYWDLHPIGYVHVLAGGCEWDKASDGRPGHYKSPVRNSSEFSALPAGQAAGLFSYNKVAGTDPQSAFFWTATASSPFAGSPQAYACEIYDGQSTVRKDDSYNLFGNSIRCVRDFEIVDPTNKPTVTTNEATNIGMYAATMNGEITIPDGVTISAKGFKWKTAESTNYITEYLTGNDMSLALSGLTAGTEYSYFAFAIYGDGTAFGEEKTFSTWAKPTVTTGSVTNVGVSSATLNGSLTNPNGVTITSKGFEWKFTEGNSNYTRIVVEGSDNNFTTNFTGLTSSKGYTIRTFVEYDGGPSYGGETSFMTKTPPTVSTSQTVTYVGANAAALSGEITALGNVNITERGIEVKVTGTPDDSYVQYPNDGTGNSFTVDPTTLTANTNYTFRAYAKYEGGISYGEAQTFTTKVEPTVTTDAASNIGVKTATMNGTFTNTGEVPITAKGFEWKLASAQTFTPVTVTGDEMTYNLTGLTKSTEYQYKAFITFDGHTVYGTVVTFSTNAAPEVSQTAVSDETTNSANLNCTFDASQNTIIEQGFQWKISGSNDEYATVTETDGVTVNGTAMTYHITGLTGNTNYTCHAFVTTADTTVYGEEATFVTNELPTVTTGDASNVGVKIATMNGTFTKPTNVTITSKGFVWALNSATKFTDTVTCDELTYNLAELTESTAYKYKAFIVFDGDSLFGEVKTFTTKAAPSVTTNEATNKGVDTVMLNGVIAANENTIIKKGFLWKPTEGNHTYDTVTEVVVSGDNITYELFGLTYNTSYTYRAFAKTADTTIYGVEKTFSTPNPALSVDLDVPSEIAVCAGGSKAVTYTASVKEGTQNDFTDEYEYQWDVPSDFEYTVNKNECTVIYTTTGSYTVSCTANHSSGASLTKNAEVTVGTTEGAMPTFTTCEDDNSRSVTIKSQENVNNFDWGGEGTLDGGSDIIYIYSNAGVYTITASSVDDCTVTKTVSIGNKTVKPCTIDPSHPAQTDITGGGFNGAKDGLETVENGKITSITDFDGNVYPVVQIGSQCWLAENMRCTHSPSTSSYFVNLENKTGLSSSLTYRTKLAEWYANDSATYAPRGYGLLYNWCAAVDTFDTNIPPSNTNHHTVTELGPIDYGWEEFPNITFNGHRRGICPKGWHVPNYAEWRTMLTVVNESELEESIWLGSHAAKLAKGCDWAGTSNKIAPSNYNCLERNESGFNAVPAGNMNAIPNTMKDASYYAYFWSSQQINNGTAYPMILDFSKEGVSLTAQAKSVGMSVRCVRDAEIVPMVFTGNASNIGLHNATLGGTVEYDGNDIDEYGFEYKPSGAEDYLQITATTILGNSFSVELSDLASDTSYNYRAYVRTSDLTYYYGYYPVTFSTKRAPKVITGDADVTGHNTATLSASITNPDGISINAKGFEWKETEGGTYTSISGEGTGNVFVADLSTLNSSTSYTVKAFITFNNTSTVYGQEKTFQTEEEPVTPTSAVLSITSNAPGELFAVCADGSIAVTYTANVEEGLTNITNSYTYVWDVPTGQYTVDGNKCTVIYTSANDYSVSCTATPTNEGDPLMEHVEINIASATGTVPTFTTCEDNNARSVTIMYEEDVASLDWGGTGTSSGDSYTYLSDGVYTITAMNGSCASTKQVAIGLTTLHPCSVGSHAAQTNTSGWDGKETTSFGKITSVYDYDGNPYPVVEIGNQCWMKTNLRTTHFYNGDEIPEKHYGDAGDNIAPYFIRADQNTSEGGIYQLNTYGLYYSKVAAMNGYMGSNDLNGNVRGACPTGWHIPSQDEWDYMIGVVSENEDEVGVKIAGGCDWYDDSDEDPDWFSPGNYYHLSRNISDFSALPAGGVYADGGTSISGNLFHYSYVYGVTEIANFWTSTSHGYYGSNTDNKKFYTIDIWFDEYEFEYIPNNSTGNVHVVSVRCVRDE